MRCMPQFIVVGGYDGDFIEKLPGHGVDQMLK